MASNDNEPIVENTDASADEPEVQEAEAAAPVEPAPNVIWSSERIYKQVTKEGEKETVVWVSSPTDTDKEGKLKYGAPPAKVKIGIRSIPVPVPETQLAGFYSDHARALVRNINGYKYLQPKG